MKLLQPLLKRNRRVENTDVTARLEEMCVDIFAHAHLDYEITLSGNGINPCEAAGVAWEILDILHGDGRKWVKANQNRIDSRAKKIEKEVG